MDGIGVHLIPITTMHKPFFFTLLLLLFALSVAQDVVVGVAVGDEAPAMVALEISDVERAIFERITGMFIGAAFDTDPSGILTLMLASSPASERVLPGFRGMLGITEEQVQQLRYLMDSKAPENVNELEPVLQGIMESIQNDPDYVLTDEESATFDWMLKYALEAANDSVAEALTDEQIQRIDGAILALTGGIESPFFNERHMAALEMTDEQREQFNAINGALQSDRDKMIAAISREMVKMAESGDVSFQGLLTALSSFRQFTQELRRQRMAVLTDEQIAKVRELSRLQNLVPPSNARQQWMPDAGSWQPGDPLPVRPAPRPLGTFPRLGVPR